MPKRIALTQAWEGSADCRNCTIRSSALFGGLTEHDFETLHEPIEQLTLMPGSVLYNAGDSGHHLFTVRSGLLKLVRYLPDGSQRIVRLAQDMDVLGLEMMVAQQYEHEAIVLRTAALCRYPKDAVSRLIQQNPTLHQNLMARWQKALNEADTWITLLSTGSSRKRMANLLLLLNKGETASECFLLSREDIGSMLSMTIETTSRTISEFKRAGFMKEISHNHFNLDIPALKAIVSR